MEILYFLLPVATVVSTIWYFIRQMNAASYLRRPTAAPTFSANTDRTASDQPSSLEQRYVDWFTSEQASRAREKQGSADDEESLVGSAFMPDGQAYRPDYEVRRVIH